MLRDNIMSYCEWAPLRNTQKVQSDKVKQIHIERGRVHTVLLRPKVTKAANAAAAVTLLACSSGMTSLKGKQITLQRLPGQSAMQSNP